MSEPTIQELFSLKGRVALITGGSGYLGQSLSRALAEAGATVVVGSRDLDRAKQVVDHLPSSGGAKHRAVVLDQMEESSLNSGFDAAVAEAGQVDILINNGQQGHALDLTNVTAEAFNKDLQNATGYFLLARRMRDHVVSRGTSGSIVMIGSMYGVVGSYPDAYDGICVASPVQYHALKGGIVHMTRHLAVYWAKDNVRVNCLSPGPFPSEKAPQAMVERLKQKNPMGRMGVPHELKGPLLMLVSDAGSYVTGQNLLVDGGWTAW
ncbi:SDR family oxidoreductase [Schlesneria paludicola]|uniref:SDR family oxidoreductase n=1 Tax=Schlesneria paludicola TaxID=360056 RepID=UPI00029AF7EC|nr:SDR family oxidoreductase [Schlesneria paludicola]